MSSLHARIIYSLPSQLYTYIKYKEWHLLCHSTREFYKHQHLAPVNRTVNIRYRLVFFSRFMSTVYAKILDGPLASVIYNVNSKEVPPFRLISLIYDRNYAHKCQFHRWYVARLQFTPLFCCFENNDIVWPF